MSDFISISPLTKSAVKSQAAYYFRKLLTPWLLLLVFDFCINVEIWFLQILNAKPLRVSLAPEGQRSLWWATRGISGNVLFKAHGTEQWPGKSSWRGMKGQLASREHRKLWNTSTHLAVTLAHSAGSLFPHSWCMVIDLLWHISAECVVWSICSSQGKKLSCKRNYIVSDQKSNSKETSRYLPSHKPAPPTHPPGTPLSTHHANATSQIHQKTHKSVWRELPGRGLHWGSLKHPSPLHSK